MGIHTLIEWADSTVNGQMGCKGCELWIPDKGVRRCYAGVLTERYAGQKGWPVAFDQPTTFPERILQACKWKSLLEGGSTWTPPALISRCGTPENAVAFHLNSRKGGDMREWPEDLRIRRLPTPLATREWMAPGVGARLAREV